METANVLPINVMIAGKLHFTRHAVHRYRQRFGHKLSYEKALAELIKLSETLRFCHGCENGCEMWRAPGRSSMRVVVRRNPKPLLPTVLTVLPHRRRNNHGA